MSGSILVLTLSAIVAFQNCGTLFEFVPAEQIQRFHTAKQSVITHINDLDMLSQLFFRVPASLSGVDVDPYSLERTPQRPAVRYGLPQWHFDISGTVGDLFYQQAYTWWYGPDWISGYGCDARKVVLGEYQRPLCIAAFRSGMYHVELGFNYDSLRVIFWFHWRETLLLTLTSCACSAYAAWAVICWINGFGLRRLGNAVRQYGVKSIPALLPPRVYNGEAKETDAEYLARFADYELTKPIRGGLLKSGVPTIDDVKTIIDNGSHILIPTKSKRHAHKRTAGGVDYCGFSFPYRTELECIAVRKTSCGLDYEIWTPFYCQSVGVPTPAPRQTIISGKTFIEAHDLVTCLDNDDTIERVHLDGIATRLATESGDKTKLYDIAASFLRSKLLAESCSVKDLDLWCIYLCSRVNEAAVTVGPSIGTNLPFDASVYERVKYALGIGITRLSNFNSMPKWTFPQKFAPAYTVYSVAKNVEVRDPLRPEPTMPFQSVRPTDVSTTGAEHVSSASPDGRQCANIDGKESAGTATCPSPAADGENTSDTKPMLLDSSLARDLFDETDTLPASSRVGCDVQRETGATDQRSCSNNVVPEDIHSGITQDVGDWTLYLLPDPSTTSRWNCTFEGGPVKPFGQELTLFGCKPCLLHAVSCYEKYRGDPLQHLGKFTSQGKAGTCTANAQGVSQSEPCAQQRQRISRSHSDSTSNADAVPEMGETVSDQASERANRREKWRARKGQARESRRNR